MHYDRVTVVDHPMVQHKLSKLRNKNTSSKDFRALVRELAMFEGYEATRDLALEDVEVETPICKAACKQVAGKKMARKSSMNSTCAPRWSRWPTKCTTSRWLWRPTRGCPRSWARRKPAMAFQGTWA